jgi:hypothetical protein
MYIVDKPRKRGRSAGSGGRRGGRGAKEGSNRRRDRDEGVSRPLSRSRSPRPRSVCLKNIQINDIHKSN